MVAGEFAADVGDAYAGDGVVDGLLEERLGLGLRVAGEVRLARRVLDSLADEFHQRLVPVLVQVKRARGQVLLEVLGGLQRAQAGLALHAHRPQPPLPAPSLQATPSLQTAPSLQAGPLRPPFPQVDRPLQLQHDYIATMAGEWGLRYEESLAEFGECLHRNGVKAHEKKEEYLRRMVQIFEDFVGKCEEEIGRIIDRKL